MVYRNIIIIRILTMSAMFLIFFGVYFLIKDSDNFLEEPVAVNNYTEEVEEIIVSTADEEPTEENSSPDKETKEDSTTNTPNSNNSGENKNNSEISTTVTTKQEQAADPNDSLRREIENKYNIEIKYGNEIGSYKPGDISITAQVLDSNVIKDNLQKINSSLAVYPPGFFQETFNIGLSLKFYLIKSYSQNNVTGITDSRSPGIIISLSTDYNIVDSIHHEIFHYLENYLLNKNATFKTWNNFNPQEFNYSNVNKLLSCNNGDNPYFINNYAQVSDYEDRASTFEFMMNDKLTNCFLYNNIRIKAVSIATQLDMFFTSVSPNKVEYWERHIN